uniref:Putative N-acetylmannosamine-6-phosphate 2-epimerase n=1 Tax=Lygus hesperus TaxID=30085 RepID=A0A0A9W056_LYGHE
MMYRKYEELPGYTVTHGDAQYRYFEFPANIHHPLRTELRTPLTVVCGAVGAITVRATACLDGAVRCCFTTPYTHVLRSATIRHHTVVVHTALLLGYPVHNHPRLVDFFLFFVDFCTASQHCSFHGTVTTEGVGLTCAQHMGVGGEVFLHPQSHLRYFTPTVGWSSNLEHVSTNLIDMAGWVHCDALHHPDTGVVFTVSGTACCCRPCEIPIAAHNIPRHFVVKYTRICVGVGLGQVVLRGTHPQRCEVRVGLPADCLQLTPRVLAAPHGCGICKVTGSPALTLPLPPWGGVHHTKVGCIHSSVLWEWWGWWYSRYCQLVSTVLVTVYL